MENRCVCCGAIVPEGRMVCGICELQVDAVDVGAAISRPREEKERYQ